MPEAARIGAGRVQAGPDAEVDVLVVRCFGDVGGDLTVVSIGIVVRAIAPRIINNDVDLPIDVDGGAALLTLAVQHQISQYRLVTWRRRNVGRAHV